MILPDFYAQPEQVADTATRHPGARSDQHGRYTCPTCGYVNLIPVTPDQDGTVIHDGPRRHTWEAV